VLGFLLATVSRAYGALSMVVLLRAGTTLLLAAVAASLRFPPRVPPGSAFVIVLVGVLDTAGNVAYGEGASLGYASIVATASSAYPLIPFALGLTLLRERVAPNQLAGVALLLFGLATLGLAG
jgi:drug/metabolite transporter (DMT)-like permease